MPKLIVTGSKESLNLIFSVISREMSKGTPHWSTSVDIQGVDKNEAMDMVDAANPPDREGA